MNEEENRFDENLNLLSELQPELALNLEFHEPEKKNSYPENVSYSSLDKIDVVYVYGINKHLIAPLEKWIQEKKDRYAVFLEDDLSALWFFFHEKEASFVLKNPNMEIHFFSSLEDEIFKQLSWQFIKGYLEIIQGKKEENRFRQVKEKIFYEESLSSSLIDEYLQYGFPYYRNFYPNLFLLPTSYDASALFGKWKNIPAIICGAGPSLNKQIPLLKNVMDKALVFAGGSSLNALLAQGISPHFGAGIDPNSEQEKRLKATKEAKIPFFYRNRIYHGALKQVKGPKLYVTGSGGYDTAKWVEEELGIFKEPLEEGHNVVHFCTSIAHAMGCSPLIYIGMDLAFTNDQSYALGVSKEEEKKLYDDESLSSQKDIFGNPIRTLWKWIAESKWLSSFANEHEDTLLLNATEGGIGFEGVENISFQEVIEKKLIKSFPFAKMIQEEIALHSFSFLDEKKIKSLLTKLEKSLTRCQEICEQILMETEKIKEKIQKEKERPFFEMQTAKTALLETEFVEEIGYRAVLDTFALISTQLIQKDVARLQKMQLSSKEENLEKLFLSAKRFLFLKETCQIHVELIKKTLSTSII